MPVVSMKVLLAEGGVPLPAEVRASLEKGGFRLVPAASADEAVKALGEQMFDVVVADLDGAGKRGPELLKAAKKGSSLTEVVFLSATPRGDAAHQALRQGALEVLGKPVDPEALEHLLFVAREKASGTRHGMAIERLVRGREAFPQIVAESLPMREVLKTIDKVAGSSAPVLILGESGTGKELIARTIHLKSARARATFLPLNCAGFSEALLESELFGHQKGAFTGAQEMRRGLFEVAHEGTLFLDEIGEMAAGLQASFLRVLESGEFRRVGGTVNLNTDVRIVAATNRDLAAAIRDGKFRKDLYYRLNTVVLTVPSLRERREDVWPLAQSFLRLLAREAGKPRVLADEVRPAFERYAWPGNVRELRNLIERLVLLTDHEVIRLPDLPLDFALGGGGRRRSPRRRTRRPAHAGGTGTAAHPPHARPNEGQPQGDRAGACDQRGDVVQEVEGIWGDGVRLSGWSSVFSHRSSVDD